MANITVNDFLSQMGYGESIAYGSRRRRATTMQPHNPVAMQEAYHFVMADTYRMANEALKMKLLVTGMQARGEAFDDIKDKVKSGFKKVKEWVIKLYEKVIKFFNETVRYFFSNEKKALKYCIKVRTKLQGARAKEGNWDKAYKFINHTKLETFLNTVDQKFIDGMVLGSITATLSGMEDEDEILAELSRRPRRSGSSTTVLTDILKRLSRSNDTTTPERMREELDEALSSIKDAYKEEYKWLDKAASFGRQWSDKTLDRYDGGANVSEKKRNQLEKKLTKGTATASEVAILLSAESGAQQALNNLTRSIELIIEKLQNEFFNNNIRRTGKAVRLLKKAKAKIAKEFKEDSKDDKEMKDSDNADNIKYQKQRIGLNFMIKGATFSRNVIDKIVGKILVIAKKIEQDLDKCTG